jgi:lipid A disaccharide synthetase
VIHYWASLPTYLLGKALVTVPYITLVNLLLCDNLAPKNPQPYDPDRSDAEQALFPEYPTRIDKSHYLARHVVEWLTDDAKHAQLIARLEQLKQQVSHGGASERACEYILRELRGEPKATSPTTSPPLVRRAA